MESIVRTVYGSYLQTVQLVGLPFNLVPYTTLNEKLSIQSGVAPASGVIPTAKYFAIGNGGHKFTVVNGIGKPEPVQHQATDAALYNQIPFVYREPNNDLTTAEQANYGLRRQETINGVTYIGYYLRRVDPTTLNAVMNLVTQNSDGTSTVTPFAPDSSNLNPTPPVLDPASVSTTTGDYVQASCLLPLIFSADDVTELLNVANVLYGDPDLAIISEIALVSGVDKAITVTTSGQTAFNFNEVIAAQCVSFINTFYALQFAQSGITDNLDIGAVEPLYNLGATGT